MTTWAERSRESYLRTAARYLHGYLIYSFPILHDIQPIIARNFISIAAQECITDYESAEYSNLYRKLLSGRIIIILGDLQLLNNIFANNEHIYIENRDSELVCVNISDIIIDNNGKALLRKIIKIYKKIDDIYGFYIHITI